MAIIGSIDLLLGVSTSAFNTKMKESANVIKETFDLDSKSANSVAALEMKLRRQAETYGMSANQAALYKLQVAGINPAALEASKALIALIEETEALNKAQEEIKRKGKATFEGTRTAAEKYRESVDDLREQLQAGAIDQNTFNRAMKNLPRPDSKVLGFGKTLAGGLTLVATAATGAAAALGVYSMSALKGLKDQGDFANALGISVKDFTELQYAAAATGSHVEDVQPALKTFSQQLGEAQAEGVGPTIDGLKMLGMSIEDITKIKNPAEQFKAIHKGFQSLKSPAEQAAAANLLFAEDGIKLLNTLKSSPAVLEKFGKDAEKLGQSWSDADAKMAGDAVKSVDQIWGVFSGIGSKIAVGFAPIITDLSTKFLDWATSSLDVGKIVSSSLDMVGLGLGFVADGVNGLKVGWLSAQSVLTRGSALFIDGLRFIGKGLESVINLIPGMSVKFTGTLDAMSKDLHNLAGQQWADAKKAFDEPPSNRIVSYFDKMKASAAEAAKAINKTAEEARNSQGDIKNLVTPFTSLKEDLQKQIDTFGLTEAQKKIAEFKKLGASPDQVKELEGLQSQLKGKEDFKKLQDAAKSFKEKLAEADPFSKFAKSVAELKKLKAAGLISQNEFAKGVKEAGQGVVGETKFAAALDVGSKDVRSAILAYNGAGQKDRGIDSVAKNTADANTYLKTIAAAMTRSKPAEQVKLLQV